MRVLITGGYGFLGRNIAIEFKMAGCNVFGMGHGKWDVDEFSIWGFNEWFESTITFEAIVSIKKQFDLIIHCGGSGSVATSHENPFEYFQKTVLSTLALL